MAQIENAIMFDPAQEATIKRRRRLAEIMREQGKPKDTEVIGGYAVPQSGLEQLARGLSGGIGAYQASAADTQEQELAKNRQALMAQAIAQMGSDPKSAAQTMMQDPSMLATGVSLYGKAIDNEADISKEAAKYQREAAQKNTDWERKVAHDKEMVQLRSGYAVNPDTGEIEQVPGSMKPLPVGALKLQDDALENLGAADSVAADTARLSKLAKDGALELGPVTNITSRLRNYLGFSSPTSQAYADMTTSLEKIRNDSLRLNKGVQTEGDAIRAMNEVLATRNDPVAFAAAMDKLTKINQRASMLQKNRINSVRKNYGAGEYDFGGIQAGQASAAPPAAGGWKIEEIP